MADKSNNRRWLSFNLKTLLLLVLISGIACRWFGVRLQQARLQSKSVAAVERLGGKVWYDYQEFNWEKPTGPEWLRDLLGPDFFDQAVRVEFSALPGIPNNSVTDISFLSGMDHLRKLYLDWTAVQDISPLANLKELSFLSLNNTQVDDLSPLAVLQRLNTVSLNRTNVSDLSPLKEHKLKRVWLRGTNVSDISPLAVESLVFLDLYKTNVSDISTLSSATQLETLSLNWTNVSDVKPLMGLEKLKSLDIGRTKVTSDSVRELEDALPECQIIGP